MAEVASELAIDALPVGKRAALRDYERVQLAPGVHITEFLHSDATRKVLEVLRKR